MSMWGEMCPSICPSVERGGEAGCGCAGGPGVSACRSVRVWGEGLIMRVSMWGVSAHRYVRVWRGAEGVSVGGVPVGMLECVCMCVWVWI